MDASPVEAVAALLAGLLSSGWTRSELVLLMNEAADIAYEAASSDRDGRSEVFDDFLEVLKGWLPSPQWPQLSAKGDDAAWREAKDGESRYLRRKKEAESK